MVPLTVLILAATTSAGAVMIGVRAFGLEPSRLRLAIGRVLECVGTILTFVAANLALGLAMILVSRSLTGAFVSTYLMGDVALLGVSCLQGLLFYCWRLEYREPSAESHGKTPRRGGEKARGVRRVRE